ncbi:archease [Candidatus Woesearchaeota archaeon]|nr:archease [Candidatus Woesearchaeota archaeon]
MVDIKFLEHTADAKFQAYGQTLEQAFISAGVGMFNLLTNVKKIKPKISHNIKVEASSKEALLYDFIDELLFLVDTEGFIPCEIDDFIILKKENEFIIQTTVYGDSYKNYEVHGDIKAATYNDMIIDENYNQKNRKVMVQVVVDI